LDRDVTFANEGDHAKDMILLQKDKNNARQLLEKYGKEKAIELFFISSALWSLNSNARQHAFVASMVNDYVQKHPASPAAQALVEMRTLFKS
jgi:hypothetical protein